MTTTLPAPLRAPRKAARKAVEPVLRPPTPDVIAPPLAPVRVVGIDLSLTATGLAWSTGEVQRHGRQGLTLARVPLDQRARALHSLADEIQMLALYRKNLSQATQLAVIENLPTGRTAGGVVSTEKAYVWWEFVRQSADTLSVLDVAPAVVKKYATGKGNASKAEVIDATARRMPWYDTRGDDNLCDAAWLCAIGCELLGHPIVQLPASHRIALVKLQLPEELRR